MNSHIHLFFALLFFIGQSSAQAKLFANQYCEFELPPAWNCLLEGSEWVCQSSNKDRQKEAIIVLAAKVRGSQDSIEQYMEHLKKAKVFNLPGGSSQVSEPKYTKLTTINGHRWVDSLHMASEVPSFYTRYLSTVKEDLGVAITFTVSKDHYSSYKDLFEASVNTLKVFRQKDSSGSGKFSNVKTREEDLFAKRDQNWVDSEQERLDINARQERRTGGGGDAGDSLLWIILLLAAAGGFALFKLKAKKKK